MRSSGVKERSTNPNPYLGREGAQRFPEELHVRLRLEHTRAVLGVLAQRACLGLGLGLG